MAWTRTHSRAGFSLVELLLVIAILVVLLGLFLPAVQKVRETASRAHCQNHLKQIALALHTHHDTLGVLPHGGHHVPPDTCGDPTLRGTEWSWCYHILPFLEQEAIYRATTQTVDGTPIKTYYCPSRRSPAQLDSEAKTDYAGNAGTNASDAGLDGVILRGPHARLRLIDILDGTSNTVLVGEKRMNLAMLGETADDNQPYNRPGWTGYEVYRKGSVQPAQDFRAAGSTAPSVGFGSSHPAGFNCVFADGSVRPVRYTVDLDLWRRACIASDGQSQNSGEF